jgi:hypothetical protein
MDLKISITRAIEEQEKRLEELKAAWIEVGRNQVLYLLLCLGDEEVAHDNWHPDRAQILLDARREIVKRFKHPREDGSGVMNTFWPREWPDFEKYTYRPG